MNTHCGDRYNINSTAQFLSGLDTEQFSAEHSLKWVKHPNVPSVTIRLPNVRFIFIIRVILSVRYSFLGVCSRGPNSSYAQEGMERI